MFLVRNKLKQVLVILVAFSIVFSGLFPVSIQSAYAATTTINLKYKKTIWYGSGDGGYTTLKVTNMDDDIDGDRPVLCMEPSEATPPDGKYSVTKTVTDSSSSAMWQAIKAAVYFTPGYPGYSAYAKDKWFSDYTSDKAIGIMHLAVSYLRAGRPSDLKTWNGTHASDLGSIWTKAKAVADDCYEKSSIQSKVPDNFKLYVIDYDTATKAYQEMAVGYMESVGGIKVVKKSKYSFTVSNSNYNFKNAEYTVYSNSDCTKKVGVITTDSNGKGSIEVSPGKYYVKETKPSKGYALDTKKYTVNVESNETSTVNSSEPPQYYDVDFWLKKINPYDDLLPGATYNVRYYKGNYSRTELEAAIDDGLVCDRYWNLVTNEKGRLVLDEKYKVGGKDFYRDENGNPIMPLGTLRFVETKAPAGYIKDSKSIVRQLKGDNSDPKPAENQKETYNPITHSNEEGEVDFSSYALETSTGTKVMPIADLVTVRDTITYKGLIPGETYKIKSYIRRQASGTRQSLDGGVTTITTDFVPKTSNGTTTIEMKIKTSSRKGVVLVVGQQLYRNGDLVAEDDDTDNLDQALYVPGIDTVALDAKTNEHYGKAEKSATVVDTVDYVGTLPGETYTLVGTLMNKSTGEEVASTGTTHVEKTFKATDYSGQETMKFNFDATVVAGKTIVVFEQLIDKNGNVVYEENSWSKQEQTIRYPIISTGLVETGTGSKLLKTSTATKLTDKITYTNLYPNTTVEVKGKIINKATGKVVATANKEFTSGEAINGTVDLNYSFNSRNLAGETLVAYAEFYAKDNLIAGHTDINDKDQTVYFPDVTTLALDGTTGIHLSPAKATTITDTVSYDSLEAGKQYKLVGKLMDASSKTAVATSTATFTAAAASGKTKVTFNIDGSKLDGKKFVVFEELYQGDTLFAAHADYDDANQTIYIPKIGTTAVDSDTNDHIANPDGSVTIVDTVSYTNLEPGRSYTLTGTLMSKATGQPLLVNGQKVTASKSFKPSAVNGSEKVTFTFDGKALAGQEVVVFESLAYNNTVVAKHEEIKDGGQTVSLPLIGTTALDKKTAEHISCADTNAEIVDTVAYSGLLAGKTYTLEGELVNKATGKTVATGNGSFTATAAKGTANVTFKFDASKLAGETVVVFETLKLNGKVVEEHKDINNTDQTVYLPKIGTTALDKETQMHLSNSDKEATIVDEIKYENLIVGKEYTVKGVLMDQKENKPLLVDGEQVTAEANFTPETKDGSVSLEFTFDAKAVQGTSVTAFEDVYYKDVLVATHSDITDEGQTVEIPKIRTNAIDSESKDHYSYADKEVTIIDTVTYTSLRPGKKYTVKGVLMDKDTQKPILVNGEQVTAESTFTPETKDGSVDITFVFDGTGLEGTAVVAFESLEYEGREYATHADITDEDQTVYFPEIKTTAADSETKTNVSLADKEITLVDTVSYKNVKVGQTYTVKGVLMSKETGKAMLNAEGKEITSEAEFTAEAAEGSVEVTFVFDGTGLENNSTVAFEYLWLGDIILGEHSDINDEGQTIDFPDIHTTATDAENGTHMSVPDEKVTVTDVVKYENLREGVEYIVKGTLMDKETGKPVLVDGKEVTSETKFTPEEKTGEVELTFKFNGTALANKTVVAFEDVYKDDILVGVHADINDDEQTIHLPKIGTTAKDAKSGTNKAEISKETKIIDTVEYENLIPGEEYTVEGVLMDSKTGKPVVKGIFKREIKAKTTFTPKKANGSVNVTFEFSSLELKDQTVVVFERAYAGKGKLIGLHEDLTDKKQSITFWAPPTYTGDDTNMMFALYFLLPVLTIVLAAYLIVRKRRRNEH